MMKRRSDLWQKLF